MKKLTIFVDMDGTIERLLDVWIKRLNKKYNRNVTYEMITSWDISAAYEGISLEQVLDELNDETIWLEVEPMPHALEVLKEFIAAGHSVYIVTATPYDSLRAKMEKLLFRCFPFITWDNVIVMSRKQLLHGDVLIDDAVHNLVGGTYRKILIDAPYNRFCDDNAEQITRVKSWLEIREIIRGMEE